MKVEEVVPSSGLLPTATKLTLIIPKDDSASSSSDGADSGCLAESPEFGKEDSLGHSDDGCLTPDMARRAGSRQPSGGSTKEEDILLLRPEDSKISHTHSKSSSTTSEESSGNLGPEEWSQNSFPSRVVTSYIEINCNKRDLVASDSVTSKMESNDVYNRINMQDSNDNTILDNCSVSKAIDCTHSDDTKSKSPQSLSNGNTKVASNSNSAEDLSDSNSNDSYKLPVKSMESQSNSGTEDMSSHTTTTTNSMSDDTKPSQSSAITANANCSHEITLSLSQLSDFEITKQKIKEMRKSFLTNLASDGFPDDEIIQDASGPTSGESSFLVHLQNKRANRLKQKMESQQTNPSLVGSRFGHPNHLLPSDDSSRNADTNLLFENRLFEGMEMKDWMALRETSVSPGFQQLHCEEQRSPKVIDRYAANLDIVNANAPVFLGSQALSLPPSANVSPIHCVPLINHGLTFVPRASSNPCSPYHSVLNPNQARSSPIPVSVNNGSILGPLTPRKSFFKDPLGQCYGECLSRSADSNAFNVESKEIHKQYFRTRSLEEGNKTTSKQKSSSPVSSIRRVFSHHRSPKIGVSPLESSAKSCTNHPASELNGNCPLEDHTYENTMNHLTDRSSTNINGKNKNSSNSELSNMWLFEKTAQLLRLKKNGHKDKRSKLGNGNKSDSDSEHTQQKMKLKEACINVAHALFSLPSSPERTRETRSQSPPSVVACPRLGPPVAVEQLDRDSSLSRQVRRRQHLLSAAESSPRNSFHDPCPCPSAVACQCTDTRYGSHCKGTPEGLQRSPAFIDGWQKISLINRPSSAPNITDVENCRTKSLRSIKRNLKHTDHDATTSSDDDYADDYCQTDECGDDCDYCSGDDAGDEEEDDVCDRCQTDSTMSSVCKHSRVLTSGILKSCSRGNGRVPEGGARVGGGGGGGGGRVLVSRSDHQPRSMPTAAAGGGAAAAAGGATVRLQQHPRRRRSATSALPSCSSGTAASSARQHGLGAIRESSATSDDQPDTDEEQYSHDGSNCDLSRSWRFGLSRDAVPSRDSTLCSDSSSTSVPVEHFRLIYKEKSNSLPGAYTKPLPADPLKQRPGSTVLRLGSTSEEDTGIPIPVPCHPTRPPRAPRTRCPSSPNPTTAPLLSTSPGSPRPTMGVQGLQRSPNMPRPLHVSGLPTSPRLLHAPRTVAPRSPNNPNPPYGFSMVAPIAECPPPGSPKTSCRAGGLVTRNFSISDDENSRRCARRHVTISRHETAYREAAERGYVLPPGSTVDPYWLTWKLGVLQKTLEEVDSRLEVAEGTVTSWGPVPQDPNLADQHVHNVTKFREGLSELQRGVDDVNDQAARFSAHSVPLAADTSTRLHRLNARWKSLEGAVSDRWRHVAGRSREVTPLTAAQLASSLPQPWERAVANNKVPYYINHAQETTYWDHPEMMTLLDSLADLNHIKFSAYRTASKLRALQKKLALDQANLQLVTDVFDEHGLRGQNDRLIDVADMVVVLSTLYSRISSERPDTNTTLTTDLCLNWLLNVYDSQRTGQMRVLSFRVGLVCLCKGHLEEKYRYMFRLIADPNRLVDQRKLGLLLHDCVQVPRQLGEVAAFGGSNIEPSVRSCFTKAGKDREAIEAVHFLSWVQQEPQSLVWLAVLHRVAASEHIQHQVKCNICKTCPIVGLRYRCLKCIGFDMCQQCFFDGRSSKNHKVTHPMHEYCTATTAGDEMKDFTKALKNKFKSKRSLQKHAKKGYLPVQTVLEGDPLESPSPSPQHGVGSQDMHNRLELYASRLAEVELRTNSNSTPDSEDEHGLIAQYCQSLSSGDGAPLPVPRSPLQVMAAVDADQKDELEQMIRELEEENQALQAEYEQLKQQQEPSDSPSPSSGGSPLRSEAEMLAEARLLRQHKGRLEARMTILEQHNQQLEAQLHRLRQLLQQQNGGCSPNKSGTLQTKSVTASQLATDSPAKVNGHSNQAAGGPSTSSYEGLDQMSEYVRPPPPPMGNVAHVGNLFSRAGDLERAVGNLVATVTLDQAKGSPSAAEGESSFRHHSSLAPEYERNQRQDDDDEEEEEIEQYDNNPMPAEKDR